MAVSSDEGAISSSAIREALLEGRLDAANKMLGYSYTLKDDLKLPGMLNIGKNPTVSKADDLVTVEAHIFNFNRDIYDYVITVAFRFRLRDEIRFDDIGKLISQLETDKKNVMDLLS
jgi:riboflavin kinase / FMN adenylyltransferase